MKSTPKPPIVTKSFKEDLRKTNEGLHHLYTMWAVEHLVAIDAAAISLRRFSNLNLNDLQIAIQNERTKLITDNAAYADAQELLVKLQLVNGATIVQSEN